MSSTTPGGLPYPLGTDRLMDGDDAIRALALAIDTRLGTDSGWITLPNASGITGTAQLCVRNGWVFINLHVYGTIVAGATVLVAAGGIPAAYRSTGDYEGPGRVAASVFGHTQVQATGQINSISPIATTAWTASLSYPILAAAAASTDASLDPTTDPTTGASETDTSSDTSTETSTETSSDTGSETTS